MEILGNKDQGFSVLSQHASWEPVQNPEENSWICGERDGGEKRDIYKLHSLLDAYNDLEL